MLAAIKKYPILFVFALSTTVFLGFLGDWQYQKGQQREVSDTIKTHNLSKRVINLNDSFDESVFEDGIKVKLKGSFIKDKIIFHDNRLNLGKAGYHVYTIFRLINGHYILINRGWVSMNLDRRILPNVITTEHEVTLTGMIRFPVKGVYTLNEEKMVTTYPQRLQTIDVKKISLSSGLRLQQYSVLLDSNVVGNHFSRQWDDLLPGKYMSSDKHYAYSLQWYSLAVVGLVIFLILIIKMAKNEED